MEPPLAGAAREGRGAETLGRPADGWVWGLLETSGQTSSFLPWNTGYYKSWKRPSQQRKEELLHGTLLGLPWCDRWSRRPVAVTPPPPTISSWARPGLRAERTRRPYALHMYGVHYPLYPHGGHTLIANNPRPLGPALALWHSQDGSPWFQQSLEP